MQKRYIALAIVAMFFGAVGGSLLAPQPANAVSKEIIELQQQVSQLMQAQQDMRSALDTNSATLKTLIQQSLDGMTQLNTQMGSVQKTVQEVAANTGSRIDAMTQQSQSLADNLQDVQSRVGKLAQQMTDMQNLLQSIDAKVSGGAPPAGAGSPTTPPPGGNGLPYAPGAGSSSTPTPGPSSDAAPGTPPPGAIPTVSSETLYQNALRDYSGGRYDLARQEFSDYMKNFPTNELASNAQFYLGEIYYTQNDFQNAINAYDAVIMNYPHSFKLASSIYKKASAELELGMRASGTRDLREVERRFPGSDEAHRAQAKLHEIGAATTTSRSATAR